MNEKIAGLWLQIKAMFDKEQVEQEANKAADVAQKELDKDKLKLKLEADKKALEEAIEESKIKLRELKQLWEKTKIDIEIRNQNQLYSQLWQTNQQLKELWKTAEEVAWDDNKWVWKFMKNLKSTAVWTAVISFVGKLASKIIELWDSYKKVTDEFNRFTWSAEVTKDLLSELSAFSSENWLDLTNVRDTASSLLQLWINAEDIIPTMQQLWDISAWTWANLEDLTWIFSEIQKEWNLTKDSFNDLIEAWVPIWDQLAEDLWLTVDQVKKLASEWKITDEQVSTAFQHMTEEWGVFFGAMEKNADTFEWKWNTLKTSLITLWENIASGVMPAFEWLMEDAQDTTDALMETWQTGESWMLMIQRAIFIVVNAFRWLVKVLQNVGSIFWTIVGWMYTVFQWWAMDIWNTATQLFSADAWSKLWDNIKYWIAQWVNGAIDAINKLSDWINQIPWISFWKIDYVEWWKKTEWWLFSLDNTINALEWANMAMQDTINDLKDNWSEFFTDIGDGWNNLWKTTESATKKTNATLKDLINGSTKTASKWSKDAAKAAVDAKKDELKQKRDLMIQEVEESELSENEKRQKLLDIYNWYKNELIVLEGKTNDELLKNTEEYLKEYQKEFEKASESDQKEVEKSIDKVKKYNEQIWKLWDKRDEYKDKARKSIRDVNNSIAELDENFTTDIAERYNKVQESIAEFVNKNWSAEWLQSFSKDMLQNRWSEEISWIKVKDAIEYLDLLKEQKFLEQTLTQEQKDQAELLDSQTESEKMMLEYQKQRAVLEEQKKMYEAFASQWDLWEIGKKAIQIQDDIVSYYDATKDQYVEIVDFKNQELARELLNQQTKLEAENSQLETAKEEELKIITETSNKILARWQSDTKAYKTELNNRLSAVRSYVAEVQALLASVPSSYRAYGWTLNSWVTMVWENWPEAIIAKQSAYVQPRNAVQNNSTIYNNQNSLSVNWINVWNFGSVDELLDWLKPYLTRRN